jgi:hypothetical protein
MRSHELVTVSTRAWIIVVAVVVLYEPLILVILLQSLLKLPDRLEMR